MQDVAIIKSADKTRNRRTETISETYIILICLSLPVAAPIGIEIRVGAGTGCSIHPDKAIDVASVKQRSELKINAIEYDE